MTPQKLPLLIPILVLKFLLVPALVVGESFSSPSEGFWKDKSPEQRIAATVKATLTGLTEEDIAGQMERHLQILGLRTQTQPPRWAHWRLAGLAPILLPGNISRHHLAEMVNVMALSAARNPYLHAFLMKAEAADTAPLLQKVELEGGRVLPDVVTYAVVLDRLNWAMIRDWRLMEVCQHLWTSRFTFLTLSKIANPFMVMKTYAIQTAFNLTSEAVKTKKIEADIKTQLQLNIGMAISEDIRLMNFDNALAGEALLYLDSKANIGYPHTTSHNGAIGQGPWDGFAQVSEDGQNIELRPALPRQWADLYTTWNAAFVTIFPNFPYLIVKLLIPTVSDYQDYPEAYIHHRVPALWATINYHIGYLAMAGHVCDWSSKELTQSWGKVNKESATAYSKQLSEAT